MVRSIRRSEMQGDIVMWCSVCREFKKTEGRICPKCGTFFSKYKCTRCGHEWYPRSARRPKTCPGCSSPYWCRTRVKQ